MNHFIIVVADQPEVGNIRKQSAREIYDELMEEAVWGFGANTQNIKKIGVGDKLVFYLAGKHGQVFVGTAEVSSPPILTGREEYRSKYWFNLSKVNVWNYPRSIRDYLSRLDFIKRPEVYGTYLQGGSTTISREDYLKIISSSLDETTDISTEVIIVVDDPVAVDKEELLKRAREFVNSRDSHVLADGPRKIRIESRAQKKIVAQLEDYKCQLCGWSLEWINFEGRKVHRIDVDHIVDKAKGGTEEITNLWALCPNCHVKKTLGVISIDFETRKVFEHGAEIKLHHDYHLNW